MGPGKYQDLHLFQTWWRPRTNATWILPQAEPKGEWHGGPFQPVGGWRSPTNGSVSSFSAAWCVLEPPPPPRAQPPPDSQQPCHLFLRPTEIACSWYFGKKLADDPKLQGIPIGLVGSFVGGTFIEQWIRNDTQAQCQQTLCGTPTVHAPLCKSLGVLGKTLV